MQFARCAFCKIVHRIFLPVSTFRLVAHPPFLLFIFCFLFLLYHCSGVTQALCTSLLYLHNKFIYKLCCNWRWRFVKLITRSPNGQLNFNFQRPYEFIHLSLLHKLNVLALIYIFIICRVLPFYLFFFPFFFFLFLQRNNGFYTLLEVISLTQTLDMGTFIYLDCTLRRREVRVTTRTINYVCVDTHALKMSADSCDWFVGKEQLLTLIDLYRKGEGGEIFSIRRNVCTILTKG